MRCSRLTAGVLLALACLHAAAERAPRRPAPLPAAETARVIVQFKEGAAALRAHALSAGDAALAQRTALDGRAQALGLRHGLALRGGAALGEREQVMHGPGGLSSQALAERLAADPDVAWAEPDMRMQRRRVPSDSLFAAGGAQGPASGQWYLRTPSGTTPASIDAVRAWDTTTGSPTVIVAVLDTGVRPNHPDLAGKLVDGYDFVADTAISNDGNGRDADPSDPGDWLTAGEIAAGANGDANYWQGCEPSDSSWHGTQVAGIVGAATDNAAGMAGSGWAVRVMPVRVLGKCFGYTSDILAAMRWAAGIAVPGVPANPNPAQVINLSLGSSSTPCSTAQRNAVAEITARGVVVVAAAGNSAGRAASAPANCPGVIGVAAVRHVGTKVGFSDVGPELSIAAPGGNCVNLSGACLYPILTTADTGTQGPVGPTYTDAFNASVGTSFSSPLVAGTVGLMLSARPGLSPAQVRTALQSSARPFPSSGLVDDLSGQPLQACQAPAGTDQLECYCTTSTCGAGLLDARAAVAAALAVANPGDDGGSGGDSGGGGGGGGGGAFSPLWLLGLGIAAARLARRGRARAALPVAALAAVALAPAPSQAAGPDTVPGLIVQLRDAPSHAELLRERAAGLVAAGAAGREQARWQRLVGAVPALQGAQRRAVGASAQVLRFARPMAREQALALAAELARDPAVAWVAPNGRERRLAPAGSPPGDPFFQASQWWLQTATGSDSVPIDQRRRGVPDFQTAWTSVTTGSANAIVAVLDNGIVDHPDLAGKVIAGYDLVADTTYANDGDGRDPDPTDPGDWVDAGDLVRPGYEGCVTEPSSWHGTAIAGMIAAQVNNGLGGASMNWPGRVLAVRVAAKCGADVSDIVDGMRWVAGLDVCRRSDANGQCLEFVPRNTTPARVVNISFGGSGDCRPYQDTIDEMRRRGIAIVAAAGNENAAPTRPAKCPGVIGVAALNRDGFKTSYSNFGSTISLATVGGDDTAGAWGSRLADSGLFSVGNAGATSAGAPGYFNYYGTSFSTPVAAGAAALMLAVNPALTAAQVEQGLRVSARPHVTSTLPGVAACSDANPGRCLCTTSTCGAGILDVPQALAYAANPGGYVPPVRQPARIDSAELREAAAGGPDLPPNVAPPPATGGDGGGGGGGAASPLWLFALGLAGAALRRRRA